MSSQGSPRARNSLSRRMTRKGRSPHVEYLRVFDEGSGVSSRGRRRESKRGTKEGEKGRGKGWNAWGREKKKQEVDWILHSCAVCYPPVYTCTRAPSRVCDPRDTCVFTIGCRYLRRHFRCDGVINGNWIEPQSTPSQGYRPAEIYSPDTI